MTRRLLDDSGADVAAALVASGHAFSIADATQPEFPLIWANPAFEALTGYAMEDVQGRNCRFLQGPDSDRAAVSRISTALHAGQAVTETFLNYRKDGSSWWNQVTITPAYDGTGALLYFVGVQSDVGAMIAAADQRDAARAETGRAQARSHELDHARALTLQRSLLPVLPQIPGLELAARYIPASDSSEIGGDWYDVLPLPDGSTGFAIGDVMGHDMHAAAAMGQLRSVLRSYAWEGHGPAEVLDRLNQLVCGLGMARLATCVYARLEHGRGTNSATLHWSNAGHPPPMLKLPTGEVHVLTDASSVLIGVSTGNRSIHERSNGSREIPPGSTLLFYTDGLIENRTEIIDATIARLAATFGSAPADMSMADVADLITAAAGDSALDDDQCLLLARVLP